MGVIVPQTVNIDGVTHQTDFTASRIVTGILDNNMGLTQSVSPLIPGPFLIAGISIVTATHQAVAVSPIQIGLSYATPYSHTHRTLIDDSLIYNDGEYDSSSGSLIYSPGYYYAYNSASDVTSATHIPLVRAVPRSARIVAYSQTPDTTTYTICIYPLRRESDENIDKTGDEVTLP